MAWNVSVGFGDATDEERKSTQHQASPAYLIVNSHDHDRIVLDEPLHLSRYSCSLSADTPGNVQDQVYGEFCEWRANCVLCELCIEIEIIQGFEGVSRRKFRDGASHCCEAELQWTQQQLGLSFESALVLPHLAFSRHTNVFTPGSIKVV